MRIRYLLPGAALALVCAGGVDDLTTPPKEEKITVPAPALGEDREETHVQIRRALEEAPPLQELSQEQEREVGFKNMVLGVQTTLSCEEGREWEVKTQTRSRFESSHLIYHSRDGKQLVILSLAGQPELEKYPDRRSAEETKTGAFPVLVQFQKKVKGGWIKGDKGTFIQWVNSEDYLADLGFEEAQKIDPERPYQVYDDTEE